MMRDLSSRRKRKVFSKFEAGRLPLTLHPCEIGHFVHYPEKRVYCFTIVMKKEALEEVGVLSEILKSFVRRRIPLFHIRASRPQEGKPITLVLFADMTGKENEVENIRVDFSNIPHVDQVLVSRPSFSGFSTSEHLFPLTLLGERVIILRKTLYETFIKELKKLLGTGYASLLYHIGMKMGYMAFLSHCRLAKGDLEKLIAICEALFKDVGFGVLRILHIDFEELRALVRVYKSFECEIFKGSGKHSSHFIRGLIAGWFSGLFNEAVVAEERRCIARGDDCCEMTVFPL